MVARACLAPFRPVHATGQKLIMQAGTEQQMIEAQARIALPAHPLIVPERVDALIGVEMPQGIHPAAARQALEGGPAGGLDKRIIVPGPGRDEVYAQGGNDTVYIYDVCELVRGEILSGGSGTDTLYLPVTKTQAQSMGVTISSFESVKTTPAYMKGFSLCAIAQ